MTGLVPIPTSANWDGALAILRCGHCVALGSGWIVDLLPLTRDGGGSVHWDTWALEFLCTRHGLQTVTDIVARRTP